MMPRCHKITQFILLLTDSKVLCQHHVQISAGPVTSLGLVSPGVATDGCHPIFPEKI